MNSDVLAEWGMVFVEGGTLMMGATTEQEFSELDFCFGDIVKPAHWVTVSDFYIGKYEVTQAQWRAMMGSNPSLFKGDNLPVEQVSWNDCQEFIRKLNERTGLTFRLPTEAEWEYAARGGNKSRGYKYSGSNDIDQVAWWAGNSKFTTHPVGQKAANELGLYDMTGNVSEWCSEWDGDYSNASQTNPISAASRIYCVYRGGSLDFNDLACRVSYRLLNGTPTYWNGNLGLRLALSL